MLCKEVIKNYRRAKSIEQGLTHKLFTLDNLIEQGDLSLLDKLLTESQSTREQISKIDREIKSLENNYRFLKQEVIND